ncbi:MAG: helix-turn-helix domain-containing protein [Acidimicrobiales bacterium]
MPGIHDLPDLLTVEEAASALRISRSSAYELTMLYRADPSTGLPVIRLGRRLRIPKRSLEAMLDAAKLQAPGADASGFGNQRSIDS